jgi:hypothetical protein
MKLKDHKFDLAVECCFPNIDTKAKI